MESLLGKTREEVKGELGEPDDFGGVSRKYPTPSVYKYGDIEYFFLPWKSGTCYCVFDSLNHETLFSLKP